MSPQKQALNLPRVSPNTHQNTLSVRANTHQNTLGVSTGTHRGTLGSVPFFQLKKGFAALGN